MRDRWAGRLPRFSRRALKSIVRDGSLYVIDTHGRRHKIEDGAAITAP
jgi:hypothetical protein